VTTAAKQASRDGTGCAAILSSAKENPSCKLLISGCIGNLKQHQALAKNCDASSGNNHGHHISSFIVIHAITIAAIDLRSSMSLQDSCDLKQPVSVENTTLSTIFNASGICLGPANQCIHECISGCKPVKGT
jgi:hypothetical protein